MPTAKILAKEEISIPKMIREKENIHAEDKVDVQMTKNGTVIIPIKKTYNEKVRGVVKSRRSIKELEKLYLSRKISETLIREQLFS